MKGKDLNELMQDYQKDRKDNAANVAASSDATGNEQEAGTGEGEGENDKGTVEGAEHAQGERSQQQQPDPKQQAGAGDGQGEGSDADQDTPPAQPAQPSASTGVAELTDDVVLKYLKEKKGLSVDNLDGIGTARLTPEQQEAQAKEKRDKAITFGLTEGLFDADKLQQYGVDNARTPEELAYEAFSAAQKEDDPELTEEDIRERFEDEYGLNLDEDSFRRKNGQQRLESFKQQLLNHKYGDVINAEQHYEAFVQQEANMRNYAKSVEDIFSGFDKEYTFQLSDKDNAEQKLKTYEYKFPYNEAEMDKLKKEFLSEAVLKKAAKGEVDAAALAQSITMAVHNRFTKEIIKEVAYAYLSDKRIESDMERQGVLPANNDGSSQTQPVRKPNYAVAADFIEKTTGKKVAV